MEPVKRTAPLAAVTIGCAVVCNVVMCCTVFLSWYVSSASESNSVRETLQGMTTSSPHGAVFESWSNSYSPPNLRQLYLIMRITMAIALVFQLAGLVTFSLATLRDNLKGCLHRLLGRALPRRRLLVASSVLGFVATFCVCFGSRHGPDVAWFLALAASGIAVIEFTLVLVSLLRKYIKHERRRGPRLPLLR
eukprot:TRINITY_DN15465_c0_g1_i1.p1 TRINITY_DN15465_c0_g1~~TRINITY_DN15465_c0_g1_i1.p1  ORF type:complete len:192 (+),score=12.63 TRINITY_DN15465_c0_g1_i1:157-732(+)